MGFVTVSHWTASEMSDEMIQIAQDKFVPMIMSVGASGVQMVRTGDLSMMVVTQFVDEATGMSAQEKIAEIRSKAAEEFPMTMESSYAGSVMAEA
ncbi:hypothetical protein OAI87_00495 [Paracoccaceae bacterium]|nr:hypothetical protein [Paracoccaceae bacterium]|tara:strand:+ start:315 stop:599 length:285 start_codon:yes stop_codon:yes gene_type:complete